MGERAAVQLTPEQVYRADDAAKLLGIGRSTFYTIVWFKSRKVRMTDGTVGYLASDLALYQSLRRGVERGV
jgi:predicted DNA-binding transcriptional regulator AlpA